MPKMKIQLWGHQSEAAERAKSLHYYALFFEMGAGKTATAIRMAINAFEKFGRVVPTFVFCPPVVVSNWGQEWAKFTDIDPKRVVLLTGPGEKRLKLLESSLAVDRGRIFVTNYESLLNEKLLAAMKATGAGVLIFDESHKLKNTKAKRSKKAEELANPPGALKPYTYILTGSPVLNSPMDLFMQYKVLDGGKTFGRNEFAFRARYFRDRNAGMPKDRYFPKWEVMNLKQDGVDALSEINERIYKCGMRVEKKDCLDLPPEVSVTLKVPMSRDQERLYKEMRTDFITFFNSRACTATLAITKALRLMQITSGFVSVDGQEDGLGQIIHDLGETPKLDALRELLEEIAENPKAKVLVWTVWQHTYTQIEKVCDELGLKHVAVHGGISESQKFKNIETFQRDPDCRVYIGHPGSGGIGVNLTVAGFSIFYSRTFSLEQHLQARARNHRGGSKEAGHEKITHYDLVCENTIDELVAQRLSDKLDMSEKLLGDLVTEIGAQ